MARGNECTWSLDQMKLLTHDQLDRWLRTDAILSLESVSFPSKEEVASDEFYISLQFNSRRRCEYVNVDSVLVGKGPDTYLAIEVSVMDPPPLRLTAVEGLRRLATFAQCPIFHVAALFNCKWHYMTTHRLLEVQSPFMLVFLVLVTVLAAGPDHPWVKDIKPVDPYE